MQTATQATEEIHRDENRAVNFHLIQEIGVDPSEKPSARIAAGSSFVMFAIGAVIPLIPYLLGFESLWAGLACGGVGLLIAGGARRPVHPQAGVVGRVAAAGIWRHRDLRDVCCRYPRRHGDHLSYMLRRLLLSCCLALTACGAADTTTTVSGLQYLGQMRVWPGATVDGTVIGGLSGISYDPGHQLYYVISDDRSVKNPARFYTARISLSANGIDGVEFVTTRPWLDEDGEPFRPLDIDAATSGGAAGPGGHRLRQRAPTVVLVQRGRTTDRKLQTIQRSLTPGSASLGWTVGISVSSYCLGNWRCRLPRPVRGRTMRWRGWR